ncbi:hypothetical protein ACHAXA_001281, partial [Cyclostephanos tholiformis]
DGSSRGLDDRVMMRDAKNDVAITEECYVESIASQIMATIEHKSTGY